MPRLLNATTIVGGLTTDSLASSGDAVVSGRLGVGIAPAYALDVYSYTPGNAGDIALNVLADAAISANASGIYYAFNATVQSPANAFTISSMRGFYALSQFKGTKAAASGTQITSLFGGSVLAYTDPASTGDVNTITGLQAKAEHAGDGNVIQMYGLNLTAQIDAGGGPVATMHGIIVQNLNSSTSAIGTSYTLRVHVPGGTGPITTHYGVYVGNQGRAGVSSNYGIYVEAQAGGGGNYALYTNAGPIRFGDSVTFNADNIIDTGTGTGLMITNTAASGASAGSGLWLRTNDGAATASGDRIGAVYFAAYDGSVNTVANASIESFAIGAFSTGSRPTELRFHTTASGAASRLVRLTLNDTLATLVPPLQTVALRLAGANIYELKNVIGIHSTNFNGAAIIHTSIPRASTTMFRVHVKGWIYSPAKLIDFIITGYAYNGSNGSIDGVAGKVINSKLWDFGTDGLTKRVGVDAAGNVALAIGDTSTALGSQFLSLGVDAFTSHSTVNYLSGWSIDFYGDDVAETDANFGWVDITTPTIGVLADIDLDGATITTGTVADARLSANVLLLNTTRTANTVLAGPPSGGATAPTFRALVAGDIPALAYVPTSQVTGGGIVATGGFTLTVPATGTVALLGAANPFTANQSIAGNLSTSGGTVANDNSTNLLKVVGTMPTTPTAFVQGVLFDITSAGSAAQVNHGLRVNYNAGYTGTQATAALSVANSAAGTAGFIVKSGTPDGNAGMYFSALGTTAGYNYGVAGFARAGDISVGGVFRAGFTTASNNKNGAKYIGVMGVARNDAASGSMNIGGYFGLDIADPTFVSAALIADNAAATDPIFIARDGGVAVLTIADGGVATFARTPLLNAGQQRGYVTKTANYTITDTDDVIAGDATGGAITMTLPSAVGRAGRIYTVRRLNSGTNTVSIATVSSQTILGGASPASINIAGQGLTIMSDGANWVYAYQ